MKHSHALSCEIWPDGFLAVAAPSRNTRQAEVPAAFYVCKKLQLPFSTLAGVAGSRSLPSCALALTGDEVCWLKAANVNANGSLEGLDEAQLSTAEIAEGEAVLVAQLIGLLVTFIGATLTLQLLQQAGPETLPSGLNRLPASKALLLITTEAIDGALLRNRLWRSGIDRQP